MRGQTRPTRAAPGRTFTLALLVVLHCCDAGNCAALNSCSKHGICVEETSSCACYKGWGAASDIAVYKAPDCSLKVCPASAAWFDVATGPYTAHAPAECSNQGLCDRATGVCRCFAGYDGDACQRTACPGSPVCSGHGKCMSIGRMSAEPNAAPFGPAVNYGGLPGSKTWDEDKIYGCVCDSSWEVGYGPGQVQATEYYGTDCSKRRCLGGDDPYTTGVDESDCEWFDENGAVWRGYVGSDGARYKSAAAMPAGVTVAVAPAASAHKADALLPGQVANAGAAGNVCLFECSMRGGCDSAAGTCTCDAGYIGSDCGSRGR